MGGCFIHLLPAEPSHYTRVTFSDFFLFCFATMKARILLYTFNGSWDFLLITFFQELGLHGEAQVPQKS